jgi:hypothetical protein
MNYNIAINRLDIPARIVKLPRDGVSDGARFYEAMLKHKPATLGEAITIWQGKKYSALEHVSWNVTAKDVPASVDKPDLDVDVEEILALLAETRERIERAETLLRGA